jgi:hypothetical protein
MRAYRINMSLPGCDPPISHTLLSPNTRLLCVPCLLSDSLGSFLLAAHTQWQGMVIVGRTISGEWRHQLVP